MPGTVLRVNADPGDSKQECGDMTGQMTIFDFLVLKDELEEVIRPGSMYEGGKMRIFALYQAEKDAKKRAKWLCNEYGIGGRTVVFSDGRRGFVDFNSKGATVWLFNSDYRKTYKWSEVEKCIGKLIRDGTYLSIGDMAKWDDLWIDFDNVPYPKPAYRYPPEGKEDDKQTTGI